MEIDLNKEADSETSEFENFSIREYVAAIREKDPEKCWPFGSFCDYKDFNSQDDVAPASQLAESISLFSQNVPEDSEAPELSEVQISKGKEAGSETPTAFEVEISKGNEGGSETATAFELEISKGNETASENATGLELEISKETGSETATAFELEISKGNNTGFETAPAFELEISKGNETGSETATAFELEISKGNETGSETATAFELEISKGNDTGFETATAFELEISKGNETGSETATASELEIPKGNETASETSTEMITSKELDDDMGISDGSTELVNVSQCQNEESVDGGAKTENSMAADDANSRMNLKRRKKRKFLLLSDILRDLAGPNVESYVHFDAGNADNVNSKFTIDIEDHSDGVTLGTFLKKRKGVEVTPGSSGALNKKKKQKTLQVEEPIFNEVKRSNPGPKGSQTMTKHEKWPADTHNYFATEKLAEAICSVEVEMALAKRKSSGKPIRGTSGRLGGFVPPASGSMVCQPLLGVGGTKGPGMAPAMPWDYRILVCSLNRNPADFSIPSAANRFMRGY